MKLIHECLNLAELIRHIEKLRLEWGHHNAIGCVVCTTLDMLIEDLKAHGSLR